MGKIILFNMVSLDGYFEGDDQDIQWHHVDKEVEEFLVQQLETADTILFGRRTYQLMHNFWPTDEAIKRSRKVARLMNTLPKIVFSKTLQNADWNNTIVMQEPLTENLRQLKERVTNNILIFGSANLCETLIKKDLVDEFRLVINPIVLGSGRSIFDNTSLKLRLLKVRVFGNGNVLCEYVKNNHVIYPFIKSITMSQTATQEINVKSLAKEWRKTTSHLQEVISFFSDENFNAIPFEGSWPAAQLCNHLCKSLKGLMKNISEKNEATDRAPDLYVEQLKTIILDFTQKYTSPSSVKPETKPLNMKLEVERLKELSAQVIDVIETLDLSQLCTLYPFPGIGDLTRLEWISFNLYHIQRHIRQLKNIHDHLKK